MVLIVNILLHQGRLALIIHVHFFTLRLVLHPHCVILHRALGASAHLYQYSQAFMSTMVEYWASVSRTNHFEKNSPSMFASLIHMQLT